MQVVAIYTVAGLVIGIPAYSGLWRGWTGPAGDKAWGLGALWVGVGGVLALMSSLVPGGTAPSFVLFFVGGAIVCLGLFFCVWMPPPFRPRWYRAQYTPLLRRRRR